MKTLITSILLFMATGLSAQKPVELPLWPNGAPNDNGLKGEEVMSAPYRLTNVTQPTITVYRPATPNGMTIIMCPGGAYALLAWIMKDTTWHHGSIHWASPMWY